MAINNRHYAQRRTPFTPNHDNGQSNGRLGLLAHKKITAHHPTTQSTERVEGAENNLAMVSLGTLCTSDAIYSDELKWLDFNCRVLQEALDGRHPLLDRLRFLAITAQNLDEFFSKRVGGLKRRLTSGFVHLTKESWAPEKMLQQLLRAVRLLIETLNDCLNYQLLPDLARHNVCIFNYAELDLDQQARLRDYFMRDVYPILTPLAVDSGHPFPFISNFSLSLGVMLQEPTRDANHFSRIKIPPNRRRWVSLENPCHFVPIEQVISHNLQNIFPGMHIVCAYPFRVTRNVDADCNEEQHQHRFSPAVRLEVDKEMSKLMLSILQEKLALDAGDIYPVQGLLCPSDFFSLTDSNLPIGCSTT